MHPKSYVSDFWGAFLGGCMVGLLTTPWSPTTCEWKKGVTLWVGDVTSRHVWRLYARQSRMQQLCCGAEGNGYRKAGGIERKGVLEWGGRTMGRGGGEGGGEEVDGGISGGDRRL